MSTPIRYAIPSIDADFKRLIERIAALETEKLHIAGNANTLNDRLNASQTQVRQLREALDAIRVYGSDTLSGRVDGPDDREWQRQAVIEMRNRARAALEATKEGK